MNNDKKIRELEFEKISLEAIEAISNLNAISMHEKTLKTTIMMTLYKMLENEEVFNDNLEILNKEYRERNNIRKM